MDSDLAEALEGTPSADISHAEAAENVFERDLAPNLLQVYLPIGHPGADPVGAYAIYQDAGPVEALLHNTRREVFLIVGGIGLLLLVLLYLAFHGASRLVNELSGRLRRTENRFRSMVQNSSDLVILLDDEGRMRFVSPAVERILGGTAAARTDRPMGDVVPPRTSSCLRPSSSDSPPRPARLPTARFACAMPMGAGDGSSWSGPTCCRTPMCAASC